MTAKETPRVTWFFLAREAKSERQGRSYLVGQNQLRLDSKNEGGMSEGAEENIP
jgi:hypothetical protein